MRVFIAGATGRVGQQLIKELVSKGHSVVSGVRNLEKATKIDEVESIFFDLYQDVNQLAEVIKGCDAVYFTAGSRGKDLLQTDAFGAVKLMQASEKVGISRFILLSSIFATEPEKWSDPNLVNITDYNIAKFFADNYLIYQTNLEYTIVQPGNLVEADSGSGKICINVTKSASNTIPNVAKVLSECLEEVATYNKVIQMSDGDTLISEALKNVS
ncbi:SDR family oxidoreductase [Actinomyces sp. zg-332]|uniref:SDR family oxidoreductase n=1 Tax=Actinomyces sp. zg-332 TaxID=2708340 RepID=UPI001421693C|nr:SDR family oxidoreductase [Actinomyces sp. zg-332]QPK93608.1 SDR family oxidoreductase [Actinomyces sp. zg-332]